jgi:hypothetical protein
MPASTMPAIRIFLCVGFGFSRNVTERERIGPRPFPQSAVWASRIAMKNGRHHGETLDDDRSEITGGAGGPRVDSVKGQRIDRDIL